MSRVVLCIGKRAEIPYCVPVTGMDIYSVEELCYFFAENAFLLDGSIVNRQLVDWLEEQCDLTELAELLYPLCKSKDSPESFVRTIVEYTGYFAASEGEMVVNAVRDCSGQSVGERKKTRADYYLENGKYELAIKEYELLLKEREECTKTAFEGGIFPEFGGFFRDLAFDEFVFIVVYAGVFQYILGQVFGELNEGIGFGYEVGFATQVGHGIVFTVGFYADAAFFGGAVGAFSHIGQTFFA